MLVLEDQDQEVRINTVNVSCEVVEEISANKPSVHCCKHGDSIFYNSEVLQRFLTMVVCNSFSCLI